MKVVQCLVLILFPLFISAQTDPVAKNKKEKGTLYFSWGYNKDWYSKSDLHFSDMSNGSYNFTLHDVAAIDNPEIGQIFSSDLSVPQFIYRLGYYFNDKHNLGIEIGFDHAKYIMVREQVVRITGTMNGESIDRDTLIQPGFVRFEHTNGANFLMTSLLKRMKLFQSQNGKHTLNCVLKPGIGIVIPKTDVTLFGIRRDNVFHVAGYIAGLDVSLRYEFGKHLFAETGFKGCFANYLDVLAIGDLKANHHFYVLEYLFCFGYAISL